MRHTLVRLVGWKATVLHGDPCVFDRWAWLRQNLRGGLLRTLDAGCGSGAFALYAAKIGNSVTGIDFNPGNCHTATVRASILNLPNAKFVCSDLRQLDQLSSDLSDFDQIICSETIEHIKDDRKLVQELVRRLKVGGRLLITAPYKHYRPLYGDFVSSVEDGSHVRWGYTHTELVELLHSFGLDVITTEYVSGLIPQMLSNLERVLGKVNGRLAWALTFPLRIFQFLDRPVTRITGYPYLSVAIVAVKRG
jgi:2-polyprenyl-3-methyl-5-hydroxy-6-metoxy-1,4-benzoquinol methylase